MGFITRHGATAENMLARPIVQGRSLNGTLSRFGRHQCELLALAAESESIRYIYCSPMKRALESAQIVAAHLGVSISVSDCLMEGNFGTWEGLTWEEVRTRYPSEYRTLHMRPNDFRYPKGDTLYEIFSRAESMLRSLKTEQNVLIITHSMVIASYAVFELGVALTAVVSWEIRHAVLYEMHRRSEFGLLTRA